MAVDIMKFVATSVFLKDMETPLKVAPGVEFTPKRLVHRTPSLEDIKLVKNAMNTTINDILLGITQAGLSRYINRRYSEGKKDEGATEKRNNLPKNILFRASVFVNIRPSPGIQALEKGKSDAKWTNLVGYVLLPFTIALCDDPLDYVREAKTTMDRKKNSLEAIFTFYNVRFIFKYLGVKAAAALSQKIVSHPTMSFSNNVGPLEEVTFFGHSIVYLAPTVYGHSQSYTKKMTIVLAVDQDVVPDPHRHCDDHEEPLKLIKDVVIARG